MPKFEIQRIPGAPVERGVYDDSLRVIDFLNQKNIHGNCVIKVNGIELGDDYDLNKKLSTFDVIKVFDQPHGGIGKVIGAVIKPVTKLLKPVFSLLGMGVSAKSPSISTGESANNDLTQQTNRARLYKMRPNIYGQVRSYLDLIQESLLEYVDNKQQATEFLEIGYGEYDYSSVRFSESTLASMAGASYQVFPPGTVIPEMIQGYSFDDVSDQELVGPNSASNEVLQQATSTELQSYSFGGGEFKAVIKLNNDFSYFNDSAKPLSITIQANVTYAAAGREVTKDITFKGDIYKSDIAEVTDSTTGQVTGSNYEFLLNNLSGSDLNSLPDSTTINNSTITFIKYDSITEGPFFAPFASDQLWLNFYVNMAGEKDAVINVAYWLVDDDNNIIAGTQKSVNVTINNADENGYSYLTYKISDGGHGRYAFTATRIDSAGQSQANIKSASAITIRSNVTYPDDTIVKINVRQTDSQSQSERKYNLLVTRKVISYDPSTGKVDYTLRASRSFADAVLHDWVMIAKQPVERLDLASLYGIAASLNDPQLGYFDFTFSDASQTLGDRLQTICNAANVSFNWIGGVITFWRDELAIVPDAVFSRSNMFWDEFKSSYTMSMTGGYDGVSVTYTDPVSNKSAYVYLQISDSGITEAADETINALQIKLDGCRNKIQAIQRAWQEARNVVYSRVTITVKVLETTQVVRGAVVQCPDMYDNDQQTGYLKGRDGDTFYTSERIRFGEEQMYVVMTDSDGKYRGRWECNAVPGNANSFTASADQFAINIYNGSTIQSPSRYFIASNDELNSTLWRVSSAKPNGDDTQTLTLTEYSEQIYQ